MLLIERSPKVVAVGEGTAMFGPGVVSHLQLSSSETGGQFMFAHQCVDKDAGPPLHVHTHEDEMFIVLMGQIEFTVADETIVAGAGTTVYAPRGVPHTFKGAGEFGGTFYVLATGSNFEAFYSRYAAELGKPNPDFARAAKIAEDHGIRFIA